MLFFYNESKTIYSFCAEQIRALIEKQERLYERKSELNSILEACKESENQVNNNASSSTVENWNAPFEWDSKADDLRLNIFGISSYRANQREVKLILFLFFPIQSDRKIRFSHSYGMFRI